MLNPNNSLLLIIDMQDKLINAANNGSTAKENVQKLAKTANLLNITTLLTEQYPKGLGDTNKDIKNNISSDTKIYEKFSFSVTNSENILAEINKLNKKQIVICGIESHICVLQSALSLADMGFEIFIVNNGCASRNPDEHLCSLELMKQYGIKIISTEIALFSWLKSSKHPYFKEIQALIK